MRPSPDDIARLEPVRMKRRPPQCHLGWSMVDGHVVSKEHCWVLDPFGSVDTSKQAKCIGCGGVIGSEHNQPSLAEIEACGGRIR